MVPDDWCKRLQVTAEGYSLKDLSVEDKQKVAKLIHQVVELGDELRGVKETLVKERETAAEGIHQLHDRNREIAVDNARLRVKLAEAFSLLRNYQHKVQALAALPKELQPPSKRVQLLSCAPASPSAAMWPTPPGSVASAGKPEEQLPSIREHASLPGAGSEGRCSPAAEELAGAKECGPAADRSRACSPDGEAAAAAPAPPAGALRRGVAVQLTPRGSCTEMPVQEVRLLGSPPAACSPLLVPRHGAFGDLATQLQRWQAEEEHGGRGGAEGRPRVLQYDASIGKYGAFFFMDGADAEPAADVQRPAAGQQGEQQPRAEEEPPEPQPQPQLPLEDRSNLLGAGRPREPTGTRSCAEELRLNASRLEQVAVREPPRSDADASASLRGDCCSEASHPGSSAAAGSDIHVHLHLAPGAQHPLRAASPAPPAAGDADHLRILTIPSAVSPAQVRRQLQQHWDGSSGPLAAQDATAAGRARPPSPAAAGAMQPAAGQQQHSAGGCGSSGSAASPSPSASVNPGDVEVDFYWRASRASLAAASAAAQPRGGARGGAGGTAAERRAALASGLDFDGSLTDLVDEVEKLRGKHGILSPLRARPQPSSPRSPHVPAPPPRSGAAACTAELRRPWGGLDLEQLSLTD